MTVPNFLNLSSLTILSVGETEHDYHVTAKSASPPLSCTTCRSKEIVGFGSFEALRAKVLYTEGTHRIVKPAHRGDRHTQGQELRCVHSGRGGDVGEGSPKVKINPLPVH